MLRDEIDAVVLDVGGVLLLPHPAVITGVLAEHGIDAPTDHGRFHRAHYEGAVGYDNSADDPEVWNDYVTAYLASLGLTPSEIEKAYADAAEAFRVALRTWRWRQEEACAAVHDLAALGLDLAVVSNSDGTVTQVLLDDGICQVGAGAGASVVVIVDSGVVGIAKPDRRIFDVAIESLGHDAGRMLYVGDTARNDVAGATAAGLIPIQVDPYDLYGGDHRRVRSLADVVTLLRTV